MPSSVELKFGDGDYLFALPLQQLLELQRACGYPDPIGAIFAIYGRVLAGRRWIFDPVAGERVLLTAPHEGLASVNDIFEPIRLGLIGGNKGVVNGEEVPVSAIRARQLVETYCHTAPLKESWEIAASVLYATVEGYEGAEKKSPEPKPRARKRPSTKRKPAQTAPG